jgi:hypothetical protein
MSREGEEAFSLATEITDMWHYHAVYLMTACKEIANDILARPRENGNIAHLSGGTLFYLPHHLVT